MCCSTAWWTSVLVYGLRYARFLLQLSTIHFKFPLWVISLLDKKDVHLMWQHCPIHPLKVNKVHAAEHLLQFLSASRLSPFGIWSPVETVLNEAIGSVSTIKMEDPTISKFMVEKEGMVNFHQSTRCHNQEDSSLYRHCDENLKYHSKVNKNATSISSWAHKIASCPNFFRI